MAVTRLLSPRSWRRTAVVTGSAVALTLSLSAGAVAAGRIFSPPPGRAVSALPPGVSSPLIADGVGIGVDTAVYRSSGLGPAALNTAAPAGTPLRYVDPALLPGGALGPGVSLTEAQAIGTLRRIGDNLAAAGLTYRDVTSMRVFLDNAPGTERADYDGWNRAYRQFFANVDLVSNEIVPVPLGAAATPTVPLVANRTRPSRYTIEVASLPVLGWLVEIEVDAAYPAGRRYR